MSKDSRGLWLDIAIVAGITLLALGVRFPGLDAQGLWHDELYTLGNLVGFDLYLFPGADLAQTEAVHPAGFWVERMATDAFWPNLWRNLVHEGHPPLYLLILKAWTLVLGTSASAVRLFSVVVSTMAVPFIFLAGRRVGGRAAGLLAGALFAASPFQAYFSYEARYYGLLAFMASAATWAALQMRASKPAPPRSAWVLWLVFSTGLCLTHYFGAIYCLLLLAALVLPSLGTPRQALVSRPTAVATTPLIVFSAWLPVLILQTRSHGTGHWTQGRLGIFPSIRAAATGLLEMISGPQLSAPPAELWYSAILLLICAVVALWHQHEAKDRLPVLLLLIILAHALVVFVVDTVLDHHTITVARYSSCLSVPLVLLLGLALSKLRSAGFALAGVTTLLFLHASMLTIRGERAPRQMLREAASFINEHSTPDDLVVVTPSGPTLVGLALYLDPGIPIMAMPAADLHTLVLGLDRPASQKIWSVQQRLGLTAESWAEATTPPPSDNIVRFAGLDLVTY